MNKIGYVVICLLICSDIEIYATTYYVHPDSILNSVQTALNLCSDNDTVLVGPGVYYENITWPNTPGIYCTSELGADTTILDGMDNYPYGVISVPPGIDSTTSIIGFTVQNGASMSYGGGIWCYQSSPNIINNVIRYNTSNNDGGGGGIAAWQGSPYISNNNITMNCGYGSDGGSAIFLYRSNTTLIGNTISLNEHSVAVRCVRCTLLFHKNIIQDNLHTGMDLLECSVLLDSSSIINNVHNGIICSDTGDVTIAYCNIFGNMEYGILNYTTDIINAEYNWWGDSTGPYHPDSNPGGLGDSVSDYVDFIPWLYWPGIQDRPLVNPVVGKNTIGATIFAGPLILPGGKVCKVFDITGRIVMSKKIKPGIYFIEVDNKIIQKVIKVR